jgi:tetratricopeptide (TPR) repeat protein
MFRFAIALVAGLVLFAAPAIAQLRTQEQPDALRFYQEGIDALFIGDYDLAIHKLRVAERALPDERDISFALGLAHVGAGDFEAAREPLERAVRRNNPPASAHMQLGLTYVALGERRAALAQVEALEEMLAECDCDEFQRERIETALAQLNRAIDAPADRPATPTSRT